MNVFGRLIFVLVASIFGVAAIAADFDGSKALMCSFAQIIECDAGDECFPVTNDWTRRKRREIKPTSGIKKGWPLQNFLCFPLAGLE